MWTENLRTGIMAIVIIALFGAVGAVTLNSFREDMITDITTSTVVNETITLDNGAKVNLANNYVVAVSQVLVNFTGEEMQALAAVNYTLEDANSFTVGGIKLSQAAFDGNVSKVTYTYRDEHSQYQTNVTEQGLMGLEAGTGYLDSVGIMIAIAAMMGLIVGAFYYFKQ